MSRKKGIAGYLSTSQPPQIDIENPIDVPVPPDQDMCPRGTSIESVHPQFIDLVASEDKKALERVAARKGCISDAIQKWCSKLPYPQQQRIAHIALQMLQQNQLINGFLFSMYRLLSKAPWTPSMISIDAKQAALYAISGGWCIKSQYNRNFPFSEVEFAVAAATYLGQVPLCTQSDFTQAIGSIINCLPLVCGNMFSQATLHCVECSAHCTAPVPSFILTSTWVMTDRSDFAIETSQAKPLPWIRQHGWHKEGCDSSRYDVNLNHLGPWVLLQLPS